MIISLVLILLGLATSAFFSGSETGIVALYQRRKESEGLPRAVNVWLDNPDDLFSITLEGTNIGNIVASSVATSLFVSLFGNRGELVSMVVISMLTLVACEVIPKSIALAEPVKFSRFAAGPLVVFEKILKPITFLVSALASKVVQIYKNLFGSEDSFNWEDFKLVAEEGQFKLGRSKQELLYLMFSAASKTVFDIMTPRSSYYIVAEKDLGNLNSTIIQSRDKKWVLMEDSTGKILGAIHTAKIENREEYMLDYQKDTYFVPEKAYAIDLFAEMTEADLHFALVVDEHGDVTGGIERRKLASILSGSAGKDHISGIVKNMGRSYSVDGHLEIDNLERIIGQKIPGGPYKTITGFIQETFNQIPQTGETLIWNGWSFTIQERTERTVLRIKLEPIKSSTH